MDISISQILLPFLIFGYCYAQTLETKPKAKWVIRKVGSGFAMKCRVSNGTSSDLKWTNKDGVAVGGWAVDNDRIYVQEYEGNLVLNFDTLEKTDAGAYKCSGTVNGSPLSKEIDLQLYQGMNMKSDLVQNPVIYTDAVIECNMTGFPAPEVVWTFINTTRLPPPRYRQMPKSMVITNITREDNGIYLCKGTQTVNEEPETKTYRIRVEVTIPPSMKSRPTVTNPIVGTRFEMTCRAEGTPPPTFTFKKDDIELTTNERYKVSMDVDGEERVGKLEIEKLEDNDEGKYTCIASNKGGSVQDESDVDTIVPPSLEKITSISMEEGRSAALTCVARGDPRPSIIWHIKGSETAITPDLYDHINIETIPTEDGRVEVVTSKLTFTKLKAEDTNNYTCSASNSAGTKETEGSVVVEFKPRFDKTPTNVAYGWLNHETEIKCVADAAPLPLMAWKHNDTAIAAGPPYTVVPVRGIRQVTSTLKVFVNIDNVKTVFGKYTCRAENLYGISTYNISLRRANVPSAPEIELEESTPTTIEILITPPINNGGQAVLDYKVEYHIDGNSPDTKETKKADISSNPDEPRSHFTIRDLKALTRYVIYVEARNNVGYGTPAKITEETLPIRVPEMPEIISPEKSDAGTTYVLEWKAPLTGGAPITGYSLSYSEVEVEVKDGKKTVTRVLGEPKTEPIKDGTTSYELTGLKVSSFYQLRLTAINVKGPSTEAEFIMQTADEGAPVTNEQPQMATSAIIGILIAVIIILFLIIDVTFYFTKQCGLLWTLKGRVAGGDHGAEGTDAEAADHEKEAFLKEGKQDSEEPSAKENAEVVDETEKPPTESLKELEPEDKEEKPIPEPAEEAKEEVPKASSPVTEGGDAPVVGVTVTEPPPETIVSAPTPTDDKDPKI